MRKGYFKVTSEQNGAQPIDLVARFNYDPWGRQRRYDDWTYYYTPTANVPNFNILERGFTGHEHLSRFGLINMNARLYDPEIASFLSPDNEVTDPENPQNYNRYTYALNNPLIYTDPTGNSFWSIFTPWVFLYDFYRVGFTKGGFEVWHWGKSYWKDAWAEFDPTASWSRTNNALKIDLGQITGSPFQIYRRNTWEGIQNFIGHDFASVHNMFGGVNHVEYYEGTTVIDDGLSKGAVTIGSFMVGPHGFRADWRDHLFVHEYGHYLQSNRWGPLFMPLIGMPSLTSALTNPDSHDSRWFEADASYLGMQHFDSKYGTGAKGYYKGSPNHFDKEWFIKGGWHSELYRNPRTNQQYQHPNPIHGIINLKEFLYYLPTFFYLFY